MHFQQWKKPNILSFLEVFICNRSMSLVQVRVWVCYRRVWLGKDWVGRAVMKGKNVVGPDMVLNTLSFLISSNTTTSHAPSWIIQKIFVGGKNMRRKKKISTQSVMSTGKFGNGPDFKEMLNCILQISLWNLVTHHTETVYSLCWDHF